MRRLVIIFTVFCLLAIFASSLTLMVSYSRLKQPLNIEDDFVLSVGAGESVSSLAKELADQHVLPSSLLFRVYARLNKQTQIKVGEYQLDSSDTSISLLNKLVEGDVVVYQLTLVEGWSFAQALTEIQSKQKLKQTLTSDEKIKTFVAQLGIEQSNPEGWFFPDTYQYSLGNSDVDILQTAYQRMLDTLSSLWENRDVGLPYDSAYEALIMASIVEKETGVGHERQQIAGVFVRRLQKRMRLQTDPTVIYGLGENYDGNIRRRHLSEPTPYNTYVISGLPPTPIALPGREAIYAALHPDDSEYLYFVAKGDGSHQFSETLEQHNQAVREYQINRRSQQYRSSPAP